MNLFKGQQTETQTQNSLVHAVGRREWDELGGGSDTYVSPHVAAMAAGTRSVTQGAQPGAVTT